MTFKGPFEPKLTYDSIIFFLYNYITTDLLCSFMQHL